MKRTLRIFSFSLLMISAGPALAENFSFQSCQIPRGSEGLNPPSTQAFAAAMNTAFQKLTALSELEIDRSLHCLQTGDPSQDDCAKRLEYFDQTLPIEWSIYRQTLAMTRFSDAYILENGKGPAYNAGLAGAGLLWFAGTGSLAALTSAEDARVQAEWETQLRRIRLALKKGLERRMEADVKVRKNLGSHGPMKEALILMENPDLYILIQLQNPYVQNYFETIQKMVFHLNQKRIIHQLGEHPLLGVLQKAELDHAEIIQGLTALKLNLYRVKLEFAEMSRRGVSPQPQVSRGGARDMLDYLGVAESALAVKPELCGIAAELMTQKIRLDWLKSWGLLAGAGVLFFTAPVVSVTGLLVIQAYSLTDSALTAQSSARRAFTNPDATMNFSSVQETYLDNARLGTEMLLSPLAITGVSVFKLSKLRGFFLP